MCLAHIRQVLSECRTGVCQLSDRCLSNVKQVLVNCRTCVWQISDRCLSIVGQVLVNCLLGTYQLFDMRLFCVDCQTVAWLVFVMPLIGFHACRWRCCWGGNSGCGVPPITSAHLRKFYQVSVQVHHIPH